MAIIERCRNSLAGLLAGLTGLAGCAHEPAFRQALPDSVEPGGGAIAVIGDLQQTSAIARLVRQRENNAEERERLMSDLAERMDELAALVIVGDLVFSARSARQWAEFDSYVAPFAERMPVLPAIGNHDYPCFFVELCRTSVIARGMLERFPWFEPGAPYAVESGDLLLLFLDSETGLEAQSAWLESRLASAGGRFAAALVFFHHPAFTNSIDRGAKGNAAVQAFVVPQLRAAEIPVIAFSGHVHGLEYIVADGVHYFTTAGGGGPRGPMGDEQPGNRYAGRDCPQPDGEVYRPFNYLLLSRADAGLRIDIRGFCRGDRAVGRLDTILLPL